MATKSHSKSKNLKAGRAARTGSFEIVSPAKSRSNAFVTFLATEGIFLAVPKGTVVKRTAFERRIEIAYKKSVAAKILTERVGVDAVKVSAKSPEKARLVGAKLSARGRAEDFPWASNSVIDKVVDLADTLSSEEMAHRLHTTRQTVMNWTAAGRLLGIEGAKRGVRYPAAQLGPNAAPVTGLAEIIEALDGDRWEAWRFLASEIGELEGVTGFELLKADRLKDLLSVLEARSYGSFS